METVVNLEQSRARGLVKELSSCPHLGMQSLPVWLRNLFQMSIVPAPSEPSFLKNYLAFSFIFSLLI